jgi:hypothetical protein
VQRLIRLLLGPMIGFGVSALIVLVGQRFAPRDVVAPIAVGTALAAVTYFSPTGRRRGNLPFAIALGVAVALFFAVSLRFLGPSA